MLIVHDMIAKCTLVCLCTTYYPQQEGCVLSEVRSPCDVVTDLLTKSQCKLGHVHNATGLKLALLVQRAKDP